MMEINLKGWNNVILCQEESVEPCKMKTKDLSQLKAHILTRLITTSHTLIVHFNMNIYNKIIISSPQILFKIILLGGSIKIIFAGTLML